jgi:predicted GNAT superfamily acetyltransferase
MFTGEIEICNTDDPSDCCKIPVLLKTSRNKAVYNYPLFQWFLEKYPNIFPILRAFLGI